jgi:hypothetical protein
VERLIGLPVEIRQAGHTVASGTVDDAMPDSSILWLAPSGPQHRTMYERSLKYDAWVDLDILPKKRTSPRQDCLNNGGSDLGLTRRA